MSLLSPAVPVNAIRLPSGEGAGLPATIAPVEALAWPLVRAPPAIATAVSAGADRVLTMDLHSGQDIYRVYEFIRKLDDDENCPIQIDYESFFLTLHGLRLHQNNPNSNNNNHKKEAKDFSTGQSSARVFLSMFELFMKKGRKDLEPTIRCMDFCFESLLHRSTKESVEQSIQILRMILRNHSNQTIQSIPSYYIFQSIIKACRLCHTPGLLADANKIETIMNIFYKNGEEEEKYKKSTDLSLKK